MTHKITSREVAKLAGVSQMTVSLVFTPERQNRVSAATRKRVEEAAEQLGYRPHRAASSLRTGRTGTVGLMISGLRNPFFAELADTAERVVTEAGFQVLLDSGPSSTASTFGHHAPIRNWSVDGVLMWAFPIQRLQDYLIGPEPPVVYLGYAREDESSWAAFDLYQGGRLAMEHLWERGRRRPVYVTPLTEEKRAIEPRYLAYCDFCRDAGIAPKTLLLPDYQETRQAGRALGLTMPEQASGIDSVLCHNDVIAVGFYQGCRRAGLRIPDDFALVGFDGIEEGQSLERTLTTLRTDPALLTATALAALRARIDDPQAPPTQTRLSVPLWAGETT